jgi:hypothetical protein
MSNHSFDVRIATEYKSIELATLVSHFQYWLNANKRMGRNQHEGRTWTYQTLIGIAAVFPYWSKRQVEKLINKAVQCGILRKGNFNKTRFDRTVWYAFENESKFLLPDDLEMEDLKEDTSRISPNGEMEDTKRRNPISPNGEIRFHRTVTPIPDTITNTITNKNICPTSSDLSEHPFGRVTLFFYEQVRDLNPKIKKPNLVKWADEFRRLSKDATGNTEEEMINVIKYFVSTKDIPSSNGFKWANVIESPTSFRKSYPKIHKQMCHSKSDSSQPQNNEEFAKKLYKKFKNRSQQDIQLGYNYLQFINGMTDTMCQFDDKDFRNKCLNELNKRNLKVENL